MGRIPLLHLFRRPDQHEVQRHTPPRNGEFPGVNPGRLRWVTLAALSSRLPAPVRAVHAMAVRPGAPKVRP